MHHLQNVDKLFFSLPDRGWIKFVNFLAINAGFVLKDFHNNEINFIKGKLEVNY